MQVKNPSIPTGNIYFARLKHWTGIDRAIAFTVTARFWSAFAGLITIVLIAKFLTPQEQGYYYTFASLVGLQVVFELGFSFVVLQLATHERAKLVLHEDGRIEGDPVAHARLASVLQKSVRWYSVAAVLMACVLLPLGNHFFSVRQTVSASAIQWRWPWAVLILASSVMFQIDPIFSFLEGCGQVAEVAHMRLKQAMLASCLAWGALILHHGLFAPAMIILAKAIVGLLWLAGRRRHLLLGLLKHSAGQYHIAWRTEVWPFQWKIAISWLCSFFIFQLINPILFVYQGAVAAGRMGMSLNVVGSCGAVAMAWMNTKASPFGHMIAQRRFRDLDLLFFRTLKQSLGLLVLGVTALFLGLNYAAYRFPQYAHRVLTPWAFGFLLLAVITNHIVFSQAIYLRAHKQEPFLTVSIVSAIAVSITTYVLGRFFSLNSVAVGYFFGFGFIGLILGTRIFIDKRRIWHQELQLREVVQS